MRILDKLRRAPPPPPPAVDAAELRTIVRAPLVNPDPTAEDTHKALAWRAEAIACEFEQRAEQRRERHRDHSAMLCEAMEHAWKLARGGHWSIDNVAAFQARLMKHRP